MKLMKLNNAEENPSPTYALEYTYVISKKGGQKHDTLRYARRNKGASAVKDVAHIWEAGMWTLFDELWNCNIHEATGNRPSELLSIPLSESNIHSSCVVVVVDLSKVGVFTAISPTVTTNQPEMLFSILSSYITQLQKVTEGILQRLEKRNSKRPAVLRRIARKRYGDTHPDLYVEDMTVPID